MQVAQQITYNVKDIYFLGTCLESNEARSG